MKTFLCFLLILAIFSSCSEPMTITANPNHATATDGTLGSMKASDGTNESRGKVIKTGVDSSKGIIPKADSLRQN